MPSEIRGSDNFDSDSVGKVLQVVSTTKTDIWSALDPNFVDITGLSVTITPTSATSKILVVANVNWSRAAGGGTAGYRLVRGSTPISIADAAGSRPLISGGIYDGGFNTKTIKGDSTTYLDSPSTTSATTYKIQAFLTYSSYTWYLNRSVEDRDNVDYEGRTVSSITVMEIGA